MPVHLLPGGVCVPEAGLDSVGVAVNSISPALLGLAFQDSGQTPADIPSVIKEIIRGCAPGSEEEVFCATRTHNGEVTPCSYRS